MYGKERATTQPERARNRAFLRRGSRRKRNLRPAENTVDILKGDRNTNI